MPPDTETLYPTKHLRNQICEFFLEKRRKEPGLGDLFHIKLQELGPFLEFANSEDPIETLGQELRAVLDPFLRTLTLY